jgi:hypothetical protein
MKGFVVLPRRWMVERTFSWFGRNRRFAKDFENLAATLETFVTLASIQLAIRDGRPGPFESDGVIGVLAEAGGRLLLSG